MNIGICLQSERPNSTVGKKANSNTEQNRSTEGCSKLKRSVDMTSSGKNGLNIRTNASPKWDRMSDQLRVSLYMVMSQNVM